MIDLHSHFLFGVDDGARNSDITVQMLAQAESVGITKLLATPHVNEMTTPVIAHLIKESFHEIYMLLRKAGISVQIKLAGETNLLSMNLDLEEYSWVLIGVTNKCLLVETPFHSLPARYSKVLFDLRLKKIKPLIAHPERNIKLQNNPGLLIEWIRQGCLVQLDAGSITGQFGKKCQRFAERLLLARAVHVVGSDAHSPRGRNYHVLADAFKVVETLVDNSYARLIFEKIPGKIWDGEKVNEFSIDEMALHASGWNKIKDALNR
jgi:protein-tyrosine phosphatase